jgi:hypothetical protein
VEIRLGQIQSEFCKFFPKGSLIFSHLVVHFLDDGINFGHLHLLLLLLPPALLLEFFDFVIHSLDHHFTLLELSFLFLQLFVFHLE